VRDVKREYVALFSAISLSERLARLESDSHRLFYTWLLAQCDQWGRIDAGARLLRAKVWPLLEHSVEETADAAIDLERVGLVIRHEQDGLTWLQVPDWDEKAGRLRRSERSAISKFPEPTYDNSRSSVQDSRSSVLRGEERRGEEDKIRNMNKNPPNPPLDSGSSAESCTELLESDPNADPDPKPKTTKSKPQWTEALATYAALDTPAFRAGFEEWLVHRRGLKLKPYSPVGLKRVLGKLAEWGADRAIAAMAHSEAGNYQGIFEPKPEHGSNGFHKPAAPPVNYPVIRGGPEDEPDFDMFSRGPK
jgi:hypothetical protein